MLSENRNVEHMINAAQLDIGLVHRLLNNAVSAPVVI